MFCADSYVLFPVAPNVEDSKHQRTPSRLVVRVLQQEEDAFLNILPGVKLARAKIHCLPPFNLHLSIVEV